MLGRENFFLRPLLFAKPFSILSLAPMPQDRFLLIIFSLSPAGDCQLFLFVTS